ncbi:MAG: AAA family ATPase, partial [Bombella apis]|nr:AAA family ATPase [Bombella apis]
MRAEIMADLFGGSPSEEPEAGAALPRRGAAIRHKAGTQPLADRLRPQHLGDVRGQEHLLGPEGTLTRMLESGHLSSLILWGGPGCGKTTIAQLLAAQAGLFYTKISAV